MYLRCRYIPLLTRTGDANTTNAPVNRLLADSGELLTLFTIKYSAIKDGRNHDDPI